MAVAFEVIPAAAGSTRAPEAAKARVRVQNLGVGEHVMVKTAQGQELHGHNMKIDVQAFTLKPDHSKQTEIAYANVVKVRKNPGPVLWIVIGAP